MKPLCILSILFLIGLAASSADAPEQAIPDQKEHCKNGCYLIQKEELEALRTAIIRQQAVIEGQDSKIKDLSRKMDRSCA